MATVGSYCWRGLAQHGMSESAGECFWPLLLYHSSAYLEYSVHAKLDPHEINAAQFKPYEQNWILVRPMPLLSGINNEIQLKPYKRTFLWALPTSFSKPTSPENCMVKEAALAVSTTLNQKKPTCINSGLATVFTRAFSAQSNNKNPTEIKPGLATIPFRAPYTQLTKRYPSEIKSGLTKILTRTFCAHSIRKGLAEIKCPSGRNMFDKDCSLARNRPVSVTIASTACMLDQARVISVVTTRAASAQSNNLQEYQMPTVTWGAVKEGKGKLASRVIIYDYLRSLGVVPDELEELELPSTVDIMKERVEFLQGIGLSIDDINSYPLMLGCSVRKNLIPVLDFFFNLGFQKSDLPFLLRRYPQVLTSSVVIELVPIIKFLRGIDIERADIPIVIKKYPEVLGFKVEGTMSTSVAYLVSIGVNTRDIGSMMTQYPRILGMRVGTVIKPIVDYLINLGFPKQVVGRMIEKRPHILGYDLEEKMKSNVESLLSFGVRQECLASVIAQYPEIMGLSLKPKLSSQQHFFNVDIQVGPAEFGQLLQKMPQVVSLPQTLITRHADFLRGRGFKVEEVAKMVVACPQLLALDLDSMKLSFYYFKTAIKRSLKELVEFPDYFTYSLEGRIKPRFQRISSRGITCSLAWLLNCSDQRFEEILDANYIDIKETLPSFCMGGALESPGVGSGSEEEDGESEEEQLYTSTISVKR